MDAPVDLLLRSPEWLPLRQFYEAWYRMPLSQATGVSSQELDDVERGAGRVLPTALRDWFRLVGRHEALLDETAQDYEMPLSRIGESPRWWLLFGENQDGWHCGVLNEHTAIPNPPVHFRSFTFDLARDAGFDSAELVDCAFVRVAETLSEFVLAMAMRQVVIRSEASPFHRSGVSGAFCNSWDVDAIRSAWMFRRTLRFPAGYDPEFSDRGVIVVSDWGFAAQTPDLFDVFARDLISRGSSTIDDWRAA